MVTVDHAVEAEGAFDPMAGSATLPAGQHRIREVTAGLPVQGQAGQRPALSDR